jgi:CheY-like chemotaxis protein
MELLARDSLRIVHVENHDDFGLIIEFSLKSAGFDQPMVRCHDGILALHYFSMIEPELAPHVILLDLHQPNLDGLEVLHWLRHEHTEQDVEAYLLTSEDDPEDVRPAAAKGAAGSIAPSPLFERLIQKLDDLIAETNRREVRVAGTRISAFAELSLAPANA